MENLLHELPEITDRAETQDDVESNHSRNDPFAQEDGHEVINDRTPLLERHDAHSGHLPKPPGSRGSSSLHVHRSESGLSGLEKVDDPTKSLAGLNALEIAAVASAKKFLSQRLVQKVVQDIWDGNIIFWESLSVNAVKKARVYNKR